jgi:hypothetical protein
MHADARSVPGRQKVSGGPEHRISVGGSATSGDYRENASICGAIWKTHRGRRFSRQGFALKQE